MFRKSCEKELYAPFHRDASKWFPITEPSQLDGASVRCRGNTIGDPIDDATAMLWIPIGKAAANLMSDACPDAPRLPFGED